MDPCRGLTTSAAVRVRTKDNALVKLSKSSPLFKLRTTQKHVKPKIIWSPARIVFSSCARWRMGTGRKSLTSLDTGIQQCCGKLPNQTQRLSHSLLCPLQVLWIQEVALLFVLLHNADTISDLDVLSNMPLSWHSGALEQKTAKYPIC